jgi:hypothetical protein
MSNYRIIPLILLSVAIIASTGCIDLGDSNIEGDYVKRQLSKGKQAGTFSFDYVVHFSKRFKPIFPVDLQIRKDFFIGEVVYTKRVEKVDKISIFCDLPPGKYCIASQPVKEIHRKEFWDGGGANFEIDNSGILIYDQGSDIIYYERKIVVNSPVGRFKIPDKQSSLKLEWLTVEDAVSYNVEWTIISENSKKVIKRFNKYSIKDNKFKFDFNFKASYLNEAKYLIGWSISARDKSDVLIGYASNHFTVYIKK